MLGRHMLSSAARVLPAAASLLGHATLIATVAGSTLLWNGTAFAQASTSLRGTITDPSGGTVAGA
jgi:hypothetical protein